MTKSIEWIFPTLIYMAYRYHTHMRLAQWFIAEGHASWSYKLLLIFAKPEYYTAEYFIRTADTHTHKKPRSGERANRVTSFLESVLEKSGGGRRSNPTLWESVEISRRVSQLIFFPRVPRRVGLARLKAVKISATSSVRCICIRIISVKWLVIDGARRSAVEPDSNWFAPASFKC